MSVDLHAGRITRVFAAAVLFLTAGHLACQTFRLFLGHSYMRGLVPLFDFDREHNFPSYYSAASLAFCALLLSLIALSPRTGRADLRCWRGLAILFGCLSVDEAVGLHEKLIIPLQSVLGASGFLYYAWVIPYGLLVLVLGLSLTRFLRRLPPPTRRQFLLAAALYLSGALGLELFGGRYYEAHHGAADLHYTLLTTAEELLEMVGVVVFIDALLSFMALQVDGFMLRLTATSLSRPAPHPLPSPPQP